MVFSLNVESKMVDRSYLITLSLLSGLENWIECAENELPVKIMLLLTFQVSKNLNGLSKK